jgi:CDP-diacylglycerol--glycerol-3-phosphate 3-phosphatidyltransferase
MKRDLWTLPNLLSISRAALAVPFVAVMLSSMEGKRLWGVCILLLGALTDKLDGELARRLHCESEWGKILDPVADKFAVAAVSLVLLWLGDLPLWFVIVLLARDLLIFIGGMYLRYTRGVVLPSNKTGKWSVGVFSLTLFGALVGIPDTFLMALMVASVTMAAISLALYLRRFFSTIISEESA